MSVETDHGRVRARVILVVNDESQIHPVGTQFVMGRGGDLRLDDGRVSRRHARIVHHDDDYLLEDLNSSNGTFLNGHRIEEVQVLESDDVIRIGPYEMRFQLETNDTDVFQPAGPTQSAGEGLPPEMANAVASEPPTARKDRPTVATPPEYGGVETEYSGAVAAQPQTVDGFLEITRGSETLAIPLADETNLDHTVGLGEQTMSVLSGRIVRRTDGYWLEPTGDESGVTINGNALVSPTQLMIGDEMRLGPLSVVFRRH